MIRKWLGKTIARKLLLAFFLIFLTTYLATALVVQSAVRSAVTDSELAALSQMARLNLGNINARFEQLATDLHAWAQLDVMNDLASGDVDRRIARTLENLKHDYVLKGDIYAFNMSGQLVASSNGQRQAGTLPNAWRPRGKTSFVNKHPNPLGEGDIIALTAPIAAAFSKSYQLGTIVIAYPIKEVGAALSGQTLLYYHQDSSAPEEIASGAQKQNQLHTATAHRDTLLLSTMDVPLPNELLTGFAHIEGWVQIGNKQYLVNSASENAGLLSGWKVVMLREPEELHQTVRTAIMKLAALCLILTLPLIIAIRWLAARLTAPLRDLTQFVSAIGKTSDLSRRLELRSGDEIGVLATSFNLMAERLESGSRARHESETRLRATIDNALDAVVQMDSDGFIIGWNDQATSIFGWSSSEVIGQPLHEVIIPTQYREAHVQGLKRFLHSGEGHVLNTRLDMTGLHRDGHEFPIELSIASIMMGERYEFSGFIRDITDKKKNEEMIWRQANFDKVTGLPNRHMLHDRLTREIKKAHRTGLQIAILFIDLDHFKEINDTLGHDMGDALLIEASRRIKGCIRDSDTVARLGGDEFTVIMPEVSEAKSVNYCAQRILKVLAEPFQLGEEMMYISASIGITLYPNDATTVENLLKNADQAMYAAKNQGRNQLCY
ncbi:MAG: diguanylate cyclase, partial [Gallionellaceae bacterium]|nr:diguanylate cyclase [Gallionellaceae bacterium]